MPHWSIALAWILLAGTACARTTDEVALIDGRKVDETVGPAKLTFDGDKVASIMINGTIKTFDPKTPAVVSVSKDGKFIALNFGNGSGQVYDLTLFLVQDWEAKDTHILKQRMLTFAKRRGCIAKPDEISILFERWLTADTIEITTEDFTRREGCTSLNRSWTIGLEGNSLELR